MPPPDSTHPHDQGEISSIGTLAARMTWVLVGPALLLVTAIGIVQVRGWFTLWDISFLIVLGMTLAARWIEQRSGHGRTASGELATPAQFNHYMLAVCIGGLAVWLAVNVFANIIRA